MLCNHQKIWIRSENFEISDKEVNVNRFVVHFYVDLKLVKNELTSRQILALRKREKKETMPKRIICFLFLLARNCLISIMKFSTSCSTTNPRLVLIESKIGAKKRMLISRMKKKHLNNSGSIGIGLKSFVFDLIDKLIQFRFVCVRRKKNRFPFLAEEKFN